MPLVSVSCPNCGASTDVSLPAGHRFVTAEPGTRNKTGSPQETSEVPCDGCQTVFPVVHAPSCDANCRNASVRFLRWLVHGVRPVDVLSPEPGELLDRDPPSRRV